MCAGDGQAGRPDRDYSERTVPPAIHMFQHAMTIGFRIRLTTPISLLRHVRGHEARGPVGGTIRRRSFPRPSRAIAASSVLSSSPAAIRPRRSSWAKSAASSRWNRIGPASLAAIANHRMFLKSCKAAIGSARIAATAKGPSSRPIPAGRIADPNGFGA